MAILLQWQTQPNSYSIAWRSIKCTVLVTSLYIMGGHKVQVPLCGVYAVVCLCACQLLVS